MSEYGRSRRWNNHRLEEEDSFDDSSGGMVWWDDLPAHSTERELTSERQFEALEERLSGLTKKQRYVVDLSWGLCHEREYSFREIGEFMGISHSAAIGIYERAMARLRRG